MGSDSESGGSSAGSSRRSSSAESDISGYGSGSGSGGSSASGYGGSGSGSGGGSRSSSPGYGGYGDEDDEEGGGGSSAGSYAGSGDEGYGSEGDGSRHGNSGYDGYGGYGGYDEEASLPVASRAVVKSHAQAIKNAKNFSPVKPKIVASPKPLNNFDPQDPESDPVVAHESPAKALKAPAPGKLFEDPTFPASVMLANNPNPGKFETAHIHACSSKARTMAKGGLGSNDIRQGALGDCWFLGALSVAATRKGLLERTFVSDARANEAGMFTFQFYKFGDWRHVTVDGIVPVFKGTKSPAFARGEHVDEMWVTLIEKAYAKFHGGYEAIVGGLPAGGLLDLTGAFPMRVSLTRESDKAYPDAKEKERLWGEFQALEKDCIFAACTVKKTTASAGGVATNESKNPNGIIGGHAYGLLDFIELKDPKVRLVKLRNPWGSSEWTGKWGDGDRVWKDKPHLLKECNHTLGDDGAFLCEWGDFLEAFDSVDILHLQDNWDEKIIYGMWGKGVDTVNALPHTVKGGTDKHPQVFIDLAADGPLHVLIERPDPRQTFGKLSAAQRREKSSLPSVILALYRLAPDATAKTARVTSHTTAPVMTTRTLGYYGTLRMEHAKAGKYVLMAYQYTGLEGLYCLSVSTPGAGGKKKAALKVTPLVNDRLEVVPRTSNEAHGRTVEAVKLIAKKAVDSREIAISSCLAEPVPVDRAVVPDGGDYDNDNDDGDHIDDDSPIDEDTIKRFLKMDKKRFGKSSWF